jgi:hypothetical protein
MAATIGCNLLLDEQKMTLIKQSDLKDARNGVKLNFCINDGIIESSYGGAQINSCHINTIKARTNSYLENSKCNIVKISYGGLNTTNSQIDKIETRENINTKSLTCKNIESSYGGIQSSYSIIDDINARNECKLTETKSKTVVSTYGSVYVEGGSVSRYISARNDIQAKNAEIGEIEVSYGGATLNNCQIQKLKCRNKATILNCGIRSVTSEYGDIDVSNSSILNMKCRNNINATNSLVNYIESEYGSAIIEKVKPISNDDKLCVKVRNDIIIKNSKVDNLESEYGTINISSCVNCTSVKARNNIVLNLSDAINVESEYGDLKWIKYNSEQKADANVKCRGKLWLDGIKCESAHCGSICTLFDSSINNLVMTVYDLNDPCIINLTRSTISNIIIKYIQSDIIYGYSVVQIGNTCCEYGYGKYKYTDGLLYNNLEDVPKKVQMDALKYMKPGIVSSLNNLNVEVVDNKLVLAGSVGIKRKENIIDVKICCCPDSKYSNPIYDNCTPM